MITTPDPSQWVKATKSGPDNACLEMRRRVGTVELRDTKDHGVGPILHLAPAEMAAWLAGAKVGEFDGLIGA